MTADKSSIVPVPVPDLGGADNVEVIEVLVSVGETIEEEASLVTLESDKASMEVPSPVAGTVRAVLVNVGDSVSEGVALVEVEIQTSVEVPAQEQPEQSETQQSQQEKPLAAVQASQQKPAPPASAPVTSAVTHPPDSSKYVYAGPAVRKLARELGVDLAQVNATGPRGRLQKDDLHAYIRAQLERAKAGGLPSIPEIDFSKFGEIELEPMDKIARLTAKNMQRSWLNLPHVAHFDEASMTAIDGLRKKFKPESETKGIKLTPLAFLLKAVADTLGKHQKFNSSLHADGQHFVRKKYIHLGIAVDTRAGLMVPVIRDVDKKDIWDLAREMIELSEKARSGGLTPAEMQGGCFTISSLGAIGGLGFTPVINAPEVAILGVSKTEIKPDWDGKTFQPVNKLPLSLSYDHRAVNGADAGRFMTDLVSAIECMDM